MKVKCVKYINRCKSPHVGSSTCMNCDPDFWLDDDPYKKVKYYRALIYDPINNEYYVSNHYRFKNEIDAKKDFNNGDIFIRLITEIPEPIEERDEELEKIKEYVEKKK